LIIANWYIIASNPDRIEVAAARDSIDSKIPSKEARGSTLALIIADEIQIPLVAIASVAKFSENRNWKKLERWGAQPVWQQVSTNEAEWGISLYLHSDFVGSFLPFHPDTIVSKLRDIERRGEIVPISYSGFIEGEEKEILSGWFFINLTTQSLARNKSFSKISAELKLKGSTSLNYGESDTGQSEFVSPWARVQNQI